MATRAGTGHGHRWRWQRRFSGIGLVAVYLSALALLVVWEAHERLDLLSSACSMREDPKPELYRWPYAGFLAWSRPTTTGHVVALAIPEGLDEVQKNVCLGRVYLADVVRAVAKQSPAVIVIDKFFSPNACSHTPEQTAALLQAVHEIQTPVVVGESTVATEQMVDHACLVRKEQLDFQAPNVVRGLTRLNAELERIPLRWRVLPAGEDGSEEGQGREKADASGGSPRRADWSGSLVLAAVNAYDPAFVARPALQHLLDVDDHVYSNPDIPVARLSTTDVLCVSEDKDIRQRWQMACSAKALPVRLLGKVVVIGAEDNNDRREVLGRPLWGFQLQALYIESLLSGDYLRSLPGWTGFVLFAVFVFVIEGVPTLLIAYRPRWKQRFLLRYAYPRRRYVWVVFWVVALVSATTIAALAFRFLPPLLVYGDILFLAVTRLIYFSTESAEHPILHGHAHHKEISHAE